MDFRLKVDLNMGHFFCLRSQNRLSAELADLFMIPQEEESIDGGAIPMLFLLLRHGKVSLLFIELISLSLRLKIRVQYDMPMPFDIEILVNVSSAQLLSIYFFDLILRENHGLNSMIPILAGILSNFSVIRQIRLSSWDMQRN